MSQKIMSFPAGALRDGTLGHLAVLSGDPAEAEARLGAAWREFGRAGRRHPAAVPGIAQRNALHAMGRMRALNMVEWAQQAITLAAPKPAGHGPTPAAMLGIGLGFLGPSAGRVSDIQGKGRMGAASRRVR